MNTATMDRSKARFEPAHTEGVSQIVPLLLALAILAATGVVSIMISGPMH